jgi:hypothetical protein
VVSTVDEPWREFEDLKISVETLQQTFTSFGSPKSKELKVECAIA